MTALDNTPALISLLERQSTLYDQLGDLTEQQSQAIEAGFGVDADASPGASGEQLLTILAQRQRVIDALVQVQDELAPFRESWSSVWSQMGETDRQQVAPMVRQIEQAAARIMELDDRDRLRLEQAQAHTGEQIRKLNSTGAAVSAYRTSPPPTTNNRFTDQHG